MSQLQRQSHRRLRRPFGRPRLQQPQLAVFDGELDLLDVGPEPLQAAGGVHQLVVDGRLLIAQGGDRFDVDQSGYHVVALAAGQPFAERFVGAGYRVAGRQHPGPGVGAVVAEHHRLHDHRGTALIVEPVVGAIGNGARRIPGGEHGLDARA